MRVISYWGAGSAEFGRSGVVGSAGFACFVG